MLVGEAPGAREDESGRPFVGGAGKLLDRLLEEAGLERADVFITNVVKARPPGNRDPKADEVAHHLPWLEAQLDVIAPEALVPARPPRARPVRPGREDHRRRTGRCSSATAGTLFPMFHPAAALRNPRLRETLHEDARAAPRGAVSDPAVRIGCSGWQYRDWRGVLYPEGLGQARWLARYAEVFDTVEVNSTFYRLASREAVARLGRAAPARLLLRAQGEPLPDPHEAAARHRAGHRALLRAHPAARRHAEARPGAVAAAGAVQARRRRLAGALDLLPPGRHCFEFRHPSWFCDAVYELLRAHGAALAIGDHPERPWQPLVLTADWTFVRFHYGHRGRRGNYSRDRAARLGRRLADAARAAPTSRLLQQRLGGVRRAQRPRAARHLTQRAGAPVGPRA